MTRKQHKNHLKTELIELNGKLHDLIRRKNINGRSPEIIEAELTLRRKIYVCETKIKNLSNNMPAHGYPPCSEIYTIRNGPGN